MENIKCNQNLKWINELFHGTYENEPSFKGLKPLISSHAERE